MSSIAPTLREYSTVGIERVAYDEPLEPLPGIEGDLPEDADPDNLLPRNTDVGEVEPGFIVALHAVDPQLGAGEDDFESSYIGFTTRSPGAYEPESEEDFAVEVPVFDEGSAAIRTGVRQLSEEVGPPDVPEAEAELYPPVPRGAIDVVAKLWGVPEGEEGLQPLTRNGEQIRGEATITALDQNPEVAPAGATPPAWNQSTTLGPAAIEDSDEGPEFGASVAAGDGLSVVGAPFEDHSDDAGSVYIFEEEGPDIELDPSTFGGLGDIPDEEDTSNYEFGSSVAYDDDSGEFLAIGAPGYNNVGAVYVLARGVSEGESLDMGGGWQFIERIEGDSLSEESTLSNFTSGAEFGVAVDLDGSVIVIGVPGANDNNGAAIFDLAVIDDEASAFELEQPDSTGNDRVGESVAIGSEFGPSLLVGAPGANSDGAQTGAVYDFAFGSGDTEDEGEGIIKYVPSDGDAGDRFGSAVDVYTGDAPLEGGLATPVIGAPDHSPGSDSDGAVYVYERPGIPGFVDEGDEGDSPGMIVQTLQESKKLTDAGDGFGESVSVYRGLGFGDGEEPGDSEEPLFDLYVLGGAPDGTGIDGGTARLFEAPISLPEGESPTLGAFETVGTFTPGDGPAIDYGAAVSYYGVVDDGLGNILIGAPEADGSEGQVYSYEFLPIPDPIEPL